MDNEDTFCPIRPDPEDEGKCLPCNKGCERYVELDIAGYSFEGCAVHVQVRLLGVIAGRLARKE